MVCVPREQVGSEVIYMDNAATSYPKPKAVYDAMDYFARCVGGSGGRSGHSKSIEASRYLDAARESLAALLGAWTPECVCFALNATEALNVAIYGLAQPGCRIVTSSMEHNSVRRPLADLRDRYGCKVVIVKASKDGILEPNLFIEALNYDTAFVVLNNASNVTGAIQHIEPIARACRAKKIPLIIDAAQTAGSYPINVQDLGVSFLAFTGHKSLLGPQGTGGFIVDPEIAPHIRPLKRGGTGIRSESESQPDFMPERFESGTCNGHGIAGLAAGVEYLLEVGVQKIRDHEMALWRKFRDGLKEIGHVRVYGPDDPDKSTGIVSITVENMDPTDVGFFLDVRHSVMTRTGLHCAPLAHQTIGTIPYGTVRFSLGFANTSQEIDIALDGLARIREKVRDPLGPTSGKPQMSHANPVTLMHEGV